MTTRVHEDAASERVRLEVPGLAGRPVVGSGCCAFAAADLVRDSLAMLDGVRAVSCDEDHGAIEMELAPGASSALMAAAHAVLDGLGYPAREVRR